MSFNVNSVFLPAKDVYTIRSPSTCTLQTTALAILTIGGEKAVQDYMDELWAKKATLTQKQIVLLSDFISKMKTGPTINLLTQRLKEL